MRPLYLLLLSCFIYSFSFAQQDSLKTLVNEGTALHDKGDYEGAIKKYDEAIGLDKTYARAFYEKSLSLYVSGKYQDCADVCKYILDKFPDYVDIKHVYVNYGSALDGLNKPDEAIKVYTKGIKKAPDFYLLPFNRAITEYSQGKLEDAAEDSKKSVSLNPMHVSSHISLGYCVYKTNKIASAMALSAALVLEPEGKRAEKNLKLLLQLLGSNVEKTGEKTINITLSPSALEDKKGAEDDFHLAELMMSMSTALDYDSAHKAMSPAQRLKDKLETFATLGNLVKDKKKGFFTHFYIPFFEEMKSGNYMETASYVMYASSADEDNKKWLDEHQNEVSAFNKWLDGYKWNK